MKAFTFPALNKNLKKSHAVATVFRDSIQLGHLLPGESLPSARMIANEYLVNRHTVMSALQSLEAEGWIYSKERSCYQVASELPTIFFRPKSELDHNFPKKKIKIVPTKVFQKYTPYQEVKYRYRFPSGLGDIREFPIKEFKSHWYDACKKKNNFEYGDPAGHGPFIELVQDYLRRTRKIDNRKIVITHGSQEALFLIAQMLVRPGQYVAVEAQGYPPAMMAFKCAGAKLCPVEIDEQGIVTDSLRRVIEKYRPRFLYCTPLHQYPTTVTMSLTRRMEILELAYKHSMPIVEDDYDHEFHYNSSPLAPLASCDPGELVIYISTFSKIMFPSARLGFVALPEDLHENFSMLKRICTRQNETILQDTVARWMAEGGFDRHLRRMRQIYHDRRDNFILTLEQLKKRHSQLSWNCPDGGMALWLDLGKESSAIADRAQKNGIMVAPESLYNIKKSIGTHLRLGFTVQNDQENTEGLKELMKCL